MAGSFAAIHVQSVAQLSLLKSYLVVVDKKSYLRAIGRAYSRAIGRESTCNRSRNPRAIGRSNLYYYISIYLPVVIR